MPVVPNRRLLEGILGRRVVFVLGAGASKDAGLPLYCELLDTDYPRQVHAFLDSVEVAPKQKESFQRMLDAASSRIVAFRKYGTDVEELLDRFSSEDPALYDELVDHYFTLIRAVDTIYHCMRLPYTIEHLPWFLGAIMWGRCLPSLITFNHDLLVEYGMPFTKEYYGLRFSYGFKRGQFTPLEELTQQHYIPALPPCDYDDEMIVIPTTIPYLKLHGSFSWALCNRCDHLVVFGDDMIMFLGDGHTDSGLRCPKCQGKLRFSVIPPKRAKTILDMAGVWSTARAILRGADTVVFVGYSLPFYDQDALELFTKEISPRARIELVNPNETEMRVHFNLIFPGNEIVFHAMGFLDYLTKCFTRTDVATLD